MKTTIKTIQIAGSLLLLVLGACTPVSDDEPMLDANELEADEAEADALDEERAGSLRPTADPGPTAADPDFDQNEQLRASCTQELHPTPPQDFASRALAPGLVDPRFRVEEDQEQAALAALDERTAEGRHHPPARVDAHTLDAQARYLAEADALTEEGGDSPQALAEAKALQKARILGDELEADALE